MTFLEIAMCLFIGGAGICLIGMTAGFLYEIWRGP